MLLPGHWHKACAEEASRARCLPSSCSAAARPPMPQRHLPCTQLQQADPSCKPTLNLLKLQRAHQCPAPGGPGCLPSSCPAAAHPSDLHHHPPLPGLSSPAQLKSGPQHPPRLQCTHLCPTATHLCPVTPTYAQRLVAQDVSLLHARQLAQIEVQVGATEPGGGDADDGVLRCSAERSAGQRTTAWCSMHERKVRADVCGVVGPWVESEERWRDKVVLQRCAGWRQQRIWRSARTPWGVSLWAPTPRPPPPTALPLHSPHRAPLLLGCGGAGGRRLVLGRHQRPQTARHPVQGLPRRLW